MLRLYRPKQTTLHPKPMLSHPLCFSFIFMSSLWYGSLENDLNGKTYKALVGETCKYMSDGGCMLYTYRLLQFKQDSVWITYHVEANCTPKNKEYLYTRNNSQSPKKFKWETTNDSLTIEGFDEYGNFQIQGTSLFGIEKITEKRIEFKKE